MHLDIAKRTNEPYHKVKNDEVVKSVFNSEKTKERGMRIPEWLLTEDIKQTTNYKGYKAQQLSKMVDEQLMDVDIEKLVKGEETDTVKFADDMLNSQEDPGTRIDSRSHKESPNAKKVTDYMAVDEKVEEESAEASLIRRKVKEKLQELMASKPTSSSSKSKTNHYKHIKGAITRMRKQYGYMFHHMKTLFIPSKDMYTIAKTVEVTLKLVVPRMVNETTDQNMKDNLPMVVSKGIKLEQKKTKAGIASMVADAGESSTKSQRTSKKSTYTRGESSASQIMEESNPSGFVLKNNKCLMHGMKLKSYMKSQIVWESRKEDLTLKIPKEPTLVFQSRKRNPNAPPMVLLNKDLFYLKNGKSKMRKGQLKKRDNPDEVYSYQRIVDLIRVQYDQGYGQEFMKDIVLKRVDGEQKSYTITFLPFIGLIYENSKKEKRIMDIDEISKFCNATLKKVLKNVKKINLDVKHGYADPALSKDVANFMKFYKEYIQEHMRH
nr:hypothetical protein [Tanacetum cinerariifolium]